MKTTTFLLLLFLSSFAAFSQDNTCPLWYSLGDQQGMRYGDFAVKICRGTSLTITAIIDTKEPFQWRKDGKIIPNENKNVFITTEEGTYTAEVKTNDCTYRTSEITLRFDSNFQFYGYTLGHSFNMIDKDEFVLCDKGGTFSNVINQGMYVRKIAYQWQKDGIDIDGATSEHFFINKAGVYTVRAKDGECNVNSKPLKIGITNDKITTSMTFSSGYIMRIDPKDTLYMCENTTINLSALGDYSNYRWYKDNILINGQTDRNIELKETGVYHYEAAFFNGCDVSSEKIVANFGKTINKPNIVLPNSALGCTNDIVSILEDRLYHSYLWSINGDRSISWYENDVFKSSGWEAFTSHSTNSTYKVIVSIADCFVEESYKFIDTQPRVIKLQNSLIKNNKITMCNGTATNLWFRTDRNTDYQIQWYKDGKQIVEPEFTLNVKEAGHYYAICKSPSYSCTQYSDTVEVVTPNIVVNKITKELLDCNYQLSAENIDGIVYTWKKDGKLITGANTHEFFPKESGNYSLVTNNGYCSYESNVIGIDLNRDIAPKIDVCAGDTLKLSIMESDTYQWKGPNNYVSNLQNPQLLNVSSKENGIYTITTTRNGCVHTDSLTVNVNKLPIFTIDRLSNYCLGKNMLLSAIHEDSYVVWESPSGEKYHSNFIEILESTPKDNGIYKATATDIIGCSSTLTTEIKLSEGPCSAILLEHPKKELCSRTENELNFKLIGEFASDEKFNLYSVDYYGKKTFRGSTTQSPVKFKVYFQSYSYYIIESSKEKIKSNRIVPRFNFMSGENIYINHKALTACSGAVSLRLDSIYYKYDNIQWIKNGVAIPNAHNYLYNATESGKYAVKLEQDGCMYNDSATRFVNVKIGEINKPSIYTAEKPSICNGFFTTLSLSEVIDRNEKYQWQLNGVDIPDANNASYVVKQKGEYSLKVFQSTCMAISESINVREEGLEAPVINSFPHKAANGIIEICDGEKVTLSSNTYSEWETHNVNMGVFFQWQKDGIDIPMANKTSYDIKEIGTYRLKITQGDCIAFSKQVILKLGKPKILNLYAGYLSGYELEECTGQKTTLYARVNIAISSTALHYKFYRDREYIGESVGVGYESFNIEKPGKYYATVAYPISNTSNTCTVYSDTLNIEFKDKIASYKLNYTDTVYTCLNNLLLSSDTKRWGSNSLHQWKLNNEPITNGINNTLTVTQSGIYQLETKVIGGCTYLSEPLKVEFNKFDAKLSSERLNCNEEIQNLSIISSNTIKVYKNEFEDYINKPITYEWQLNGKIIGDADTQKVKETGTYSVSIKQGDCAVNLSRNIIIDSSMTIPKTLSPNQDSLFICPNGAVSIEAAKGDYTYMWLKDNQGFDNNQSQAIKVSAKGTYRAWIEKEGCGRISDEVVVKEKIVLPTALISGSKELMSGDSAKVKVDFTSLPPWAFKLTNNQEFTANTTPFEVAVKPDQTTVYELASVKNDCGEGTVSGKAEIRIIILGNEELAGAKVKLFPVPTQGICQLSVETVVPEKLGFQLYNVEGKILMQIQENQASLAFKEQINLESLPDGVYLLKIKVGDKLLNRKIIKGGN